MNLLIAGATGSVGFEALQLAKSAGYRVHALSRNAGKARDIADRWISADAVREVPPLDGVEIVLSCLGASVSPGHPEARSYRDVDLPANLHLLESARKAGVRRFVYVSVHVEEAYRHTRYIEAHEDFVRELKASPIPSTVIRPTGIFSAFDEIFHMARRGIGTVIGDGSARTNPIHQADVAKACIECLEAGPEEMSLGGPETLTRRQVAELAFRALGKRPRLVSAPPGMIRLAGKTAGLFRPRLGDLFEFVAEAVTHDCVAPSYGTRRLEDYFGDLPR